MYGFERKHIVRLSLILAAVVALVAAVVVMRSGPSQELGNVFGETETGFAAGQKRAGRTDIVVRLDSGVKIVTSLPPGLPFVPGARVELSVRVSGPEAMRYYTYRFLGYRTNGTSPE